jgi:cation:H+ antiporter
VASVASVVGVVLLVVGLALVIGGAELFFDALLATAARWRLSPFVLTVVVSGFELENLAAGIAANLKGLGNAAAGTFLGGTTFLALGVAGLGAAVAPIRAALPTSVLVWSASAPLPLVVALGSDGDFSRLDGIILLSWPPWRSPESPTPAAHSPAPRPKEKRGTRSGACSAG